MKISFGKVIISEKDLLNIMNEYIHIKGLTFDLVKITDFIKISGNYKAALSIPFSIKVGLGSIRGNKINLLIIDARIGKIRIANNIKNIILKSLKKYLKQYGIEVLKNVLSVDINVILKKIPYVYFKIDKISIDNNLIEVKVEDFVYSQNKDSSSGESDNLNLNRKKFNGRYACLRKNLIKKFPEKYKNIAEYSFIIPDIIDLLYRIYRDERVKIKVKIIISAIIAYLVSPIDLLPDFIPFIGEIDDIAVAFFGINYVLNRIPQNIILENWQGKESILKRIKITVNYISKAAGGENICKFENFMKNMFKSSENEENV